MQSIVAAYLIAFYDTFTSYRSPLGLSVHVSNPSDEPILADTDESYSLDVDANGAIITAATIFGALRGLETFSQLVRFDFVNKSYFIAATPWHIIDAPRFPFRGLMVDTARHYIPILVLRRVLDTMAMAKLNVFHWHHEDDQAFPMEIPGYERLASAAYSAASRYSSEDVVDLIEYARQRAIRVMVEFDVPGHASSWCTGYPWVCPSPSCLSPLNVAANATFDLIDGVLASLVGSTTGHGVFPEGLVHMGGDEVEYVWLRQGGTGSRGGHDLQLI